jgi:hypothetical protein
MFDVAVAEALEHIEKRELMRVERLPKADGIFIVSTQ